MAIPKRSRKAWIQFGIAVAIALIFGVIAIGVVFMLFGGLNARNQKMQQQFEKERAALEQKVEALTKEVNRKPEARMMQEVVVASAIQAGKPITADQLKVDNLPQGETATEGSFATLADVIGKLANRNLFPGEVITEAKLLNTANMLPVEAGKRAIALAVSPVNLLDGAIFEGARVDVLATFKEPALTRTVLKSIRVLKAPGTATATSKTKSESDAAAKSSRATGSPSIVTLEVTPGQAEILALAARQSDLHFTLRPFGDTSASSTTGIDAQQLAHGINGKAPRNPSNTITKPTPTAQLAVPSVKPYGAAKSGFTMEIIKGATSETQQFERIGR